MVTENFEKLRIMSNDAKEDNLVFIKSMSNSPFKDDSSISSQDSYLSDESQDLEGMEREIRILRSIEIAMRKFQDQDKVINPDNKVTPS
ncbi:unnamed protein product [Rhizopus microsporus]